MTSSVQIIPENAPFNPEQRAWLNGFIAGLMGLQQVTAANEPLPSVEAEDEAFPWHDETMALEERMQLAEGRPYELRLMAAMGQMDCGQCGYLCRSYAKAIATGEEQDLNLCVPGGRPTAKKLKVLVAEAPAPAAPAVVAKTETLHTRKNPFPARLKTAACLNADGSVKDTRHVVIDLNGSGLRYQPGDSLGIFPRNCSDLVEAVLTRLGATGREDVSTAAGPRSLRDALTDEYDLTKPTDEAIEYLAACAADPEQAAALTALAEAGTAEGQDLLEILEAYPEIRPDPVGLVGVLGRLQPRLYSIASSPRVHPDEVHLTVGVVRYRRGERERKGVASTFFAERVAAGGEVKIYVQPTHEFRLPENGDVPVIMVGPGTGVAPFRAFLEERQARGDRGRNWLFFGNPNAAADFLYRDELEGFLDSGLLTRLDTAFSRDQAEKIYVQHRLLEHGAEVWSWLINGGYFYVCGDAKRMARDVDQALHRIAGEHGGLAEADAAALVKDLAREKRYLRDVY